MKGERINGVTEAEYLGFHPQAIIPRIEPDQELAKFHGQPVGIPRSYEGESRDKAGYTARQRTALLELEQQRLTTLQNGGHERTQGDATADYDFKSIMY